MFTVGFPEVRKGVLFGLTLYYQAKKIKGEAQEVKDALTEPFDQDKQHLAEEVYDTIQASYTMLQLLEGEDVDIEAARRKVEEKNRAKGFYEEE